MIFIVERGQRRQFFNMRSPVPLKMAVPPDDTELAYKLLRMSTSHFDSREMMWIPLAAVLVKLGWNNTFAQRKRLAPTVMMFPSGSSQVFSLSVAAVDVS